MQSDSSSLDALKTCLLSAVDGDYNVVDPEKVLDIISQLEKIEITRDELQTTRLGREINTIRQKIDARKKSAQPSKEYPASLIDIAQRAKRLLRSWQGLLNTSQTDNHSSSPNVPQIQLQPPTSALSSTVPTVAPLPQTPVPSAPTLPGTPSTPSMNGENHESTSPSPDKPRLILKFKLNSSISANSNTDSNNNKAKNKRKKDGETNGLPNKRPKVQAKVPTTPPQPISPAALVEPTSALPRVKTTQQLLMEMQMNQPDVLSTQAPTVNAILQNQIIDESLHDTGKVDYSALHHGRDTNNSNISTNYQKQLSTNILPHVISPNNSTLSTGLSLKRPGLDVSRPSPTLISAKPNWENGTIGCVSPVSPSSSSSSSIASMTCWPNSINIPEPPSSIPDIPKKKRRKKHDDGDNQQQQQLQLLNIEQSTPLSPDLTTICSSYNTVADLVDAHRRRVRAEHDTRELEARPSLLLPPVDQLAFVYERERTRELHLTSESKQTSLTTVDKIDQPDGLVALPFIDCPLEFDLVLDELVVQKPTMNM